MEKTFHILLLVLHNELCEVQSMTNHKLKTISMDPITYQRLRKFGNTPDTFDDVLKKILELAEKHQKEIAVETTILTKQ
jgi:hypothetical protein